MSNPTMNKRETLTAGALSLTLADFDLLEEALVWLLAREALVSKKRWRKRRLHRMWLIARLLDNLESERSE